MDKVSDKNVEFVTENFTALIKLRITVKEIGE